MSKKVTNPIATFTEQQCQEWLHARVREEYGCWIWVRHVDSDGMPRGSVDGQGGRAVRRWVYACHHKTNPIGRRVIGTTCGESLCLRPDHLVARTKRDACQLASRNGSYRDPAVIARRTESVRALSAFSLDQARELRRRVQKGEKLTAVADEMGLRLRNAQAINAGKSWAESVLPNSVFAWRPAA